MQLPLSLSLSTASSITMETEGGGPLHVNLLPNPSHLEAINPVVAGKARAKLLTMERGGYGREGVSEGDGNEVSVNKPEITKTHTPYILGAGNPGTW